MLNCCQCSIPPLWTSPDEQLVLSLEEFAGRELCPAVALPSCMQNVDENEEV